MSSVWTFFCAVPLEGLEPTTPSLRIFSFLFVTLNKPEFHAGWSVVEPELE
jgi:hypothetical protein